MVEFNLIWIQFHFQFRPFRFQSSFLAQDQPKGLENGDPNPLPKFAEVSDVQLFIKDEKIDGLTCRLDH